MLVWTSFNHVTIYPITGTMKSRYKCADGIPTPPLEERPRERIPMLDRALRPRTNQALPVSPSPPREERARGEETTSIKPPFGSSGGGPFQNTIHDDKCNCAK